MKHIIAHDLFEALFCIEQGTNHKWLSKENESQSITKQEFVDNAIKILDILKEHPYLSAKAISDQTGVSQYQLAVIYKMIQRSDACQAEFKQTKNRDYFNVVNHYFNHNLYTLVFFVGTSCPSRCIYCPNVKIDSQGRRRLVKYKQDKSRILSNKTLDRVFADLLKIKSSGTDILIKISGGLEPLTDMAAMKAIITRCRCMNIPVKLFTNGLLLEDKERRAVALTTNDIRISLSTSDEDKYEEICFSTKKNKPRKKALSQLKSSIRSLIQERNDINPGCKIGFNSIILPDNHTAIELLLEMARNLDIDYVDFKPDYFSCYNDDIHKAMDESIQKAKVVASHEPYKNLFVNFTGSLSRNDLYWSPWTGSCSAVKQSQFKMFVTPYGQCSPVHYGAFPHSSPSFQNALSCYIIGDVTPHHGILDVLKNPDRTPNIDMKKLNPFELMLSLEINREESDKAWGFPICLSPYHTREKDNIPVDLFSRYSNKNRR